jgi:hypothetical protein
MNAMRVDPIGYYKGRVKQLIPFMESVRLKRLRVLLADEKLRDNVIDGLKKNIEEVLGINSDAKIITMGIFRPRMTPKEFDPLFDEMNFKLEIRKCYCILQSKLC